MSGSQNRARIGFLECVILHPFEKETHRQLQIKGTVQCSVLAVSSLHRICCSAAATPAATATATPAATTAAVTETPAATATPDATTEAVTATPAATTAAATTETPALPVATPAATTKATPAATPVGLSPYLFIILLWLAFFFGPHWETTAPQSWLHFGVKGRAMEGLT